MNESDSIDDITVFHYYNLVNYRDTLYEFLKTFSVFNDNFYFFRIHDYYLPFVGEKFNNNPFNKRVLFIGESHYIHEENKTTIPTNKYSRIENSLGTIGSHKFTNIEFSKIWYSNDWISYNVKEIIEEISGSSYFNTCNIANNFVSSNYRGRAITQMFGYPLKALYDNTNIAMKFVDKSNYSYFSFMNFFQRPCLTNGNSIYNTKLDNLVSTRILNKVISILEIDIVFFLSMKSYDVYMNHHESLANHLPAVKFVRLIHPCCFSWKKSGSSKIIRDYIFKNDNP